MIKPIRTYDIYFEQVNRTKITVEGYSKEEAVQKARIEWDKENSTPRVCHIEETLSAKQKIS